MKMIRAAIKKALAEKKLSQRQCALVNEIHYSSFSSFLKGVRPLPLADIEKVLKFLNLEIRDKDSK